MIEFGKTLREAREAKGLSVAQVAEKTHMIPKVVSALENEDFSSIVAPIYGRGFVKLYCNAVGLNAQPLIAEFMAIYNGEREPAIKERKVEAPAPAPTDSAAVASATAPSKPIEAPLPAAPEPPPADTLRLVSEEVHLPPPPTPAPSEPAQRTISRYATPIREEELRPGFAFHLPRLPKLPKSVYRLLALALILIVVVAALALGVRVLYRATSNPSAEESLSSGSSDAVPAVSVTGEKSSRTPLDIPPLYVN